MRAKPLQINEADLVRALAERWGADVERLSYQPVGGGSFHWIAVDRSGKPYFVTVDDLRHKPWLGPNPEASFLGLRSAFRAAQLLHEEGLAFVVAPIATTNGEVVIRLDKRHSLAVFPFVQGRSGIFGEEISPGERSALCQMWAALHLATPAVRSHAPQRGLDVPGRADLERAMDGVHRSWAGGAYSERARKWLAFNLRTVREGLGVFDDLAARVAQAGGELVITHGEPHAGNVIRNGDMRYLVDWDTVALALRERDLWMLDDGSDAAFKPYVDATGRNVNRDALRLYRQTWLLSDIAAFVGQLRESHTEDADTRKAWTALNDSGLMLSAARA